jgi:Spy/CpxP family protein refolding chaperone
MITRLLLLTTALACAGALAATPPTARNLPNLMPTPELALRHADEIGLTAAQRTKLEDETRNLDAEVQKFTAQVRRESDTLAELLAREVPDAAAVAAQFDKVLAAEDEVKRVRLKMSLQVRATLTPEQQKKLGTLQGRGTRGTPQSPDQQQLAAQMERVKGLIERAKSEGRDLSSMREMWKRVNELTRDGKTAEATHVLEETAQSLEKNLPAPTPK